MSDRMTVSEVYAIGKKAGIKWVDDKATKMAAALAYYTITCIGAATGFGVDHFHLGLSRQGRRARQKSAVVTVGPEDRRRAFDGCCKPLSTV